MLSALLLVVVVTVVLALRPPHAAEPDGPDGRAAARHAGDRARGATALLERLTTRLEGRGRQRLGPLAAPGDARARRELATMRDNVRSVGIDLSLRLVAPRSGPAAGAPVDGRSWVGDVRVSWRVRGAGPGFAHAEVPLTFRDVRGGTAFVTARSAADAVPLWLLERVHAARAGETVVMASDARSAGRFSRLAVRAVADVRQVLRGWPGVLVVEVPRGERQLTRVLGSRPGAYTGIAAVTTTVDGSLSRSAPVHVFVNPRAFGRLGDRGSQIVVSHEATHVAVGAALSTMPPWLLEGFADYVALARVDLPVARAARQILDRVRRRGAPTRLPGPAAFAPGTPGVGASYESAWLACRLIAARYGEPRLLAFYRAADRSGTTAGPFRTVLGTDLRTFTRTWRADLLRRAR